MTDFEFQLMLAWHLSEGPVTIDLNSVPPVAGESAMRIRDILCRSRGAFREDWLSAKFRYDQRRATEIAKAMELAAYVHRDREREERYNSPFPWYSVTDPGRDLMRASAASRIKRETANKALSEFIKRVQLVNANPRYLYSVRRVVVFGSFLQCGDRLGDIDVAVDLKCRIEFDKEHKWVELFRRHASTAGKRFSAFNAEVFFLPRREVLLTLKARKRSISIQPWHSFLEMEKTKNFQYKVLFGETDEVRRELSEARREESDPYLDRTG